MTVATIDELLGPVPVEHHYLETYGFREDRVAGRNRYVGRDQSGRAVIGPVRHGKGLLNSLRRKKKKPVVLPEQERALKIVIDHEAVRRAGLAVAQHVDKMRESIQTVDFSKLNTYAPTPTPPQKEPGMFRRFASWCTEKFYDDEWQRGMRNTAGNLLLWGFVVFSFIVFAKGALWVLSL